jgi:hypothetical protein
VVTKRLLLLANSRKFNGRCVAGREIADGEAGPWIRPVSDLPRQQVLPYHQMLRDHGHPKVLDIVDVPLTGPKPSGFQTENWLLDNRFYWTRVGRVGWDALTVFVDAAGPLWVDGHSTYTGSNDKVPEAACVTLSSSLRLIDVPAMGLFVGAPALAFGDNRRRVQGRFQINGVRYAMWVTDPVYETGYLAQPDGSYALAECRLTISLSEQAMNGYCYKLIAAVIERARTP